MFERNLALFGEIQKTEPPEPTATTKTIISSHSKSNISWVLTSNPNKQLYLWGASKKGKEIAQILLKTNNLF